MSKIIKSLKEGSLFSEISPFLAEAKGFSGQWSQGFTQSQVQPFQQGSADFKSQSGQPFCSTLDAIGYSDYPTFFSFLSHLSINQVRVRFFDWIFRTTPLPCSRENLDFVVAFYKCLHITTKSITKKAGGVVKIVSNGTPAESDPVDILGLHLG